MKRFLACYSFSLFEKSQIIFLDDNIAPIRIMLKNTLKGTFENSINVFNFSELIRLQHSFKFVFVINYQVSCVNGKNNDHDFCYGNQFCLPDRRPIWLFSRKLFFFFYKKFEYLLLFWAHIHNISQWLSETRLTSQFLTFVF